jgi:hypothetical protein
MQTIVEHHQFRTPLCNTTNTVEIITNTPIDRLCDHTIDNNTMVCNMAIPW